MVETVVLVAANDLANERVIVEEVFAAPFKNLLTVREPKVLVVLASAASVLLIERTRVLTVFDVAENVRAKDLKIVEAVIEVAVSERAIERVIDETVPLAPDMVFEIARRMVLAVLAVAL